MSRPISDKKTVQILTDICRVENITNIIISPGSRNAPLILSFASSEAFRCFTVVDERSAGFIALGMAQQTGKPVALVCTSGTAVLNYAPAIAEAYYQNIPLLVITADRPGEWIDQADGQTIRQENIYQNYIRYSCSLPVDIHSNDDEWYAGRIISEAIQHCRFPLPGPVHINVPLREPLYGRTDYSHKAIRQIIHHPSSGVLSPDHINLLSGYWNNAKRVMILVGMHRPKERLQCALNELEKNGKVIVMTETLSNSYGEGFIRCIDRVLGSIRDDDASLFQPDLLITIDGPVVSKMVKTFLRNNPPHEHWHISESGQFVDTYQQLTRIIQSDAAIVFEQLAKEKESFNSQYRQIWQKQSALADSIHLHYLENIPWSDLKVFDIILKNLSKGTVLQLGNSTPVRYAQLFDVFEGVESYSNRGTSGIDGCLSTAVGAALARKEQVLAVIGDLSFFYDSNALWNKYLHNNLKVIIVNNGGGGIFRFLPGSSETEELEEFFAVGHQMNAQHIAMQFNVRYKRCEDENSLRSLLPAFISDPGPAILEIMTPKKDNASVLKDYFVALKKQV